jgi:hypothetical protein
VGQWGYSKQTIILVQPQLFSWYSLGILSIPNLFDTKLAVVQSNDAQEHRRLSYPGHLQYAYVVGSHFNYSMSLCWQWHGKASVSAF